MTEPTLETSLVHNPQSTIEVLLLQNRDLMLQNRALMMEVKSLTQSNQFLLQQIPLQLQAPLTQFVEQLREQLSAEINQQLMTALEELLGKQQPQSTSLAETLKQLIQSVEADTEEVLNNRDCIVTNGENIIRNLRVTEDIRQIVSVNGLLNGGLDNPLPPHLEN